MKEYSITMKFSIETTNNFNVDDITEFADDELIESVKNLKFDGIKIVDSNVEEIEDLNDDFEDNYLDEEIEPW